MPRRVAASKTKRRSPRRSSSGPSVARQGLIIVGAGLGLYWLLAQQGVWHPYLTWLVAWSVTAVVVYGLDKSSAQNSAWRVPEMLLHALALIGGVVGCWAGMLLLRHKTQQSEIKLTLIVATIVHGALAMTLLA